MTCAAGQRPTLSADDRGAGRCRQESGACHDAGLRCGWLHTRGFWVLNSQKKSAEYVPRSSAHVRSQDSKVFESATGPRRYAKQCPSAKPLICRNVGPLGVGPLLAPCVRRRFPWRRCRWMIVALLVLLNQNAVAAVVLASVHAAGRPLKVKYLHDHAATASDVSSPPALNGFVTISGTVVDSSSGSSSIVVAKDAPVLAAASDEIGIISLQRRLLQTIQGDPPSAELLPEVFSGPLGRFSGKSHNNPSDFPVPDGYRPVISAVHRIMGRDVIAQQLEVEKAFAAAFKSLFDPLGIKVRWLNYTTHALTDLGPTGWYYSTEFRAVDQQVLMYQRPVAAGDTSNLTMVSAFNHTAMLQQIVTQQYGHAGVSLIVLSETALTQNFSQNQSPYGAARTVIELTGVGLLPFTREKVNAMLQSLQLCFLSLQTSRVFFANLSSNSTVGDDPDVPAAPSAPGSRTRRVLLQSQRTEKVRAVVWTGLQPLRGFNPADFWNKTFNEASAQQVYIVNSDQSIGVAYTYRNFTSTNLFLSGLPVSGRYISSQVYEMNDIREGFVKSDQPPGPLKSLRPSEGTAPADSLPPPDNPALEPAGGPVAAAAEAPMSQAPLLSSAHHISAAVIAGISVGVVILVLLLLAAGLLLWRHFHGRDRDAATADDDKLSGSRSGRGSTSTGRAFTCGAEASSKVGASPEWQWSDPESGVLDPVWAPVVMQCGGERRRSPALPLHRASELFADDALQHSTGAQVVTSRADSLPPLGGRPSSLLSSAPMRRWSDNEAAAFVNGSVDSLPSVLASGPFVAGEIDPMEIEFCLDAKGNQVVLGEGAFGRVFKALRRGVHEVAIKQLGDLSNPQLIRQFRKEIAILGRVSFQPNIVNFYGACLRDPSNIMLVMEIMAGGDLRQALSKSENGEFMWYQKGRTLALDIARGLHFLHSSQVTHRDLKTSNILLSRDGSTAKIGDVGLSRSTLTDLQSSLTSVGTFCYAAPELLMGEKCSEAIDLFSYGVCLWEVVTGAIPVRGYIRDVEVPTECPSEVRQLISDCMESDPKLRPTAEELVRRMVATPEDRPQASPPEDLPPLQSPQSCPSETASDSSGSSKAGLRAGSLCIRDAHAREHADSEWLPTAVTKPVL